MPPALCNKCHSGRQPEGDSWCLGCSSQEISARLLQRRWNNPGLRNILEETLLSAARLCRAFANLDSNLITPAASDRGPQATAKSRPDRERSRSQRRDERSPLRRLVSRGRTERPPPPPRREEREEPRRDEPEESSEEESEEEAPAEDAPVTEPEPPATEVKTEIKGSDPPPEPERPPRPREEQVERASSHRHHREERGEYERGHRSRRDDHERRDRRSHRDQPQDSVISGIYLGYRSCGV
eukprot:s1331_g1.t1